MPYICDLHSVGVIIRRPIGGVEKYLLIERSDGKGWAPVAGHIYDNHDGPTAAAIAEAWEEAGLTVTKTTLLTEGWRGNRCSGLIPSGEKPGHYWFIVAAEVTGEVNPCQEETWGAAWVTADGLQSLAESTAAVALGKPPTGGVLEAVWCHWFCELGVIELSKDDRARIADMAATPPPGA